MVLGGVIAERWWLFFFYTHWQPSALVQFIILRATITFVSMASLRYNNHTLLRLEQLFKLAGYQVRSEKGYFNSGYCILENKNVVVVNKFYDTEARINCLLDILQQVSIDESILDEKNRTLLMEALSTRQP